MEYKFQEKLISLRKEKGISQEFLADKLHVSRQTISKWELGETTPDLDNLVRLVHFFEISLDELVFNQRLLPTPDQEQVKQPKTIVAFLYDFWWLFLILFGMVFWTIKKMYWGA